MNISDYLDEVRAKYATGQASEHSYRPAIQRLFDSVDPALTVINEPKKSDVGMPDFMFQRGVVPTGWAECKDVDKDIIKLRGYSVEQRRRYEKAYPNLIYTNGVDFEFIREGERVHFVSIADFMGQLGGLQPKPDKFDELARQLRLFAEQKPISIRSAAKLAEIMAAKAAIIKDEIGIALADDPDFRSGLGGQYKSFRANLLPALTPGEFADIYAETITYGMFAARFHDDDLGTFSRQEAMEDLPASNPFLKGLFEYIAGPGLPKRLEYIVDDLVQVMRASDPHSLFRDFGKFTARNDPFVHFYEDFLAAYNPKKRKSRGVWYTPESVVDFIVRAVDDVLRTEFGLVDGLADTSKVTVDWDIGRDHPKSGKPITERREVHKVQILDPATGTGTFLAKAVQVVADRVKARAAGKWSAYVEQDLLPRLHGFELLMASYAMCHMKLDMMLGQTGYKPSAKPPRLSVWLTNALEPAEREVRDLFFQPLADEARGASEVKRQTPIMCIIGNPPYLGESTNRGPWITDLMEVYKKEPGTKRPIEERTSKWINKDEHKFIRLAAEYVRANGSGIVAMITSHGYLSDPTLRGIRWHLLNTFDSIYVLDLHGNSNRNETPPAGVVDKNVFDIKQGVSIVVATKLPVTAKSPRQLACVRHSEHWGSRALKNELLWAGDIASSTWQTIEPKGPMWRFVPRDGALDEVYGSGFGLDELFRIFGNGIVTARDDFAIGDIDRLRANFEKLVETPQDERALHEATGISRKKGWDILKAGASAKALGEPDSVLAEVNYRPFDRRNILFHDDLVWRTVRKVMCNYLEHANLGLLAPKAMRDGAFAHVFVTDTLSEAILLSASTGSNAMNFPLYLYPSDEVAQRDAFISQNRT